MFGFSLSESPRKILYIVAGACSLLLPFYTWRQLYKCILEYRETKLFYERHNCCVTYYKGKGFAGWPPKMERTRFSVRESEQIYEPLLYFLRTAKYSIDIAVMILNVHSIEKTICEMAQKGIVIRLVLDYEKCDKDTVQKLKQSGVQVKLCANTNDKMESLMHLKCAIKDFRAGKGFLLFGSLNWTYSGFVNNYEDVVFTSNKEAVRSFHENFESMWFYFDNMEKHDVITRAVLSNKIRLD